MHTTDRHNSRPGATDGTPVVDGGPAPGVRAPDRDGEIAGAASGAAAGPPPQWLLDAVADAGDERTSRPAADDHDAGAAPTHPQS